jgi:hypothetical protein
MAISNYEYATDMTREQEPRTVESFVVLDLDRTLLNSDKVVQLMCDALPRFGVSDQDAREDLAMIQAATGQSLSAFEFLGGRYGAELIHHLAADLLQQAENGQLDEYDLLYGDSSTELLDELDVQEIPFAVLTYGESLNQQFKLALYRILARRAALPAVVTDEPRKGAWIHEHWLDASEDHMRIPPDFTDGQEIIAQEVIILDDKQHNLDSPDRIVKGIRIDNRSDHIAGRLSLTQLVDRLKAGENLSEIATHYEVAA